MKKLLLSLFLIANLSNATEVTTSNLVDQNFDNGGWSGTADGRHGSNIIAAEHNTYIESNPVAVNNHLTKDEINYGFSVNASESIWHWNDYDSTVQRTIRATIPNSTEVISQTRTINSTGCGYVNCGNYVSYNDTMVIGANTVDNYNINLRYDFTDTSLSSSSHWSVDLKNPVLSITYTENPVILETSVVENLSTFDDFLFEDIQTFDFKEEKIIELKPEEKIEDLNMSYEEEFTYTPMMEIFEEAPMLQTPKTEFQEMALDNDKMQEEPTEMIDDFYSEIAEETPSEEASEEPSSLQAEQPTSEEPSKETQTPTQKPRTSQAEAGNKSSVSSEKKLISLPKIMNKIDAQVKEIDKNLVIKNLVKLDAMIDNNALLSYQIPFYKEKKIYEEQANIRDDRIIYTANLETYSRADPIFQQNSRILELQKNKKRLKQEIWLLKSKIN